MKCYFCKHWEPIEFSGFPYCKKDKDEVTRQTLKECSKRKWFKRSKDGK